MSQSNQSNEYNRLFEKYNKMSNEELSEIAKQNRVLQKFKTWTTGSRAKATNR